MLLKVLTFALALLFFYLNWYGYAFLAIFLGAIAVVVEENLRETKKAKHEGEVERKSKEMDGQ
jgi:asparagine N-glycosylation enzyme membrane subunit Stt3